MLGGHTTVTPFKFDLIRGSGKDFRLHLRAMMAGQERTVTAEWLEHEVGHCETAEKVSALIRSYNYTVLNVTRAVLFKRVCDSSAASSSAFLI